MARKVDEYIEKKPAEHGKKPNQKIKPYVVLQYLLRNTDENHVATAFDIIAFLQGCGIDAERRSIYRDIEDINKVSWMLENDSDIQEAEEAMAADADDEEKLIVYDNRKKGFYVRQRHFELNDIRLLAECVYSAKFISNSEEERLVNVVGEFVSEYQAEKIKRKAFLVGRVKTSNKYVLNNVSLIHDAMSEEVEGAKHIPQKISFSYLTHEVGDVEKLAERHKKYVVSPYQLIINDSNYYLLAYDDKAKDMRTYRVDRMKGVSFVGSPREGSEAFSAIDMKTYTQRVFGMFGGEKVNVRLRFINRLLDTVIDRFGSKNVTYTRADDNHFYVTAQVEISDQFFAWICGFGKKAVIMSPEYVRDEMRAFLSNISQKYTSINNRVD